MVVAHRNRTSDGHKTKFEDMGEFASYIRALMIICSPPSPSRLYGLRCAKPIRFMYKRFPASASRLLSFAAPSHPKTGLGPRETPARARPLSRPPTPLYYIFRKSVVDTPTRRLSHHRPHPLQLHPRHPGERSPQPRNGVDVMGVVRLAENETDEKNATVH